MASMTYSLTKNLPKEESFSLTNQMRRAANSVSSNIAEGYGRNSQKLTEIGKILLSITKKLKVTAA